MRIASLIKDKNVNKGFLTPLSLDQKMEQSKRLTRFVLTSAVVSLIALEPTIASAAGNLQVAATSILGYLTGPFGRTIATIAVIVLGIMAMFGKLAWDHAIKVILGIAIVFGAASIITAIGGNMQANIAP